MPEGLQFEPEKQQEQTQKPEYKRIEEEAAAERFEALRQKYGDLIRDDPDSRHYQHEMGKITKANRSLVQKLVPGITGPQNSKEYLRARIKSLQRNNEVKREFIAALEADGSSIAMEEVERQKSAVELQEQFIRNDEYDINLADRLELPTPASGELSDTSGLPVPTQEKESRLSLTEEFRIVPLEGHTGFEQNRSSQNKAHKELREAYKALELVRPNEKDAAILAIAKDLAKMEVDPRPLLETIYEDRATLQWDRVLIDIADTLRLAGLDNGAILDHLWESIDPLTYMHRNREFWQFVEVLVNSGRTEKAQQIFDRYHKAYKDLERPYDSKSTNITRLDLSIHLARTADLLGLDGIRDALLGAATLMRSELKPEEIRSNDFAGPISAMPEVYASRNAQLDIAQAIVKEVTGKWLSVSSNSNHAKLIAEAALRLAEHGMYRPTLLTEALSRMPEQDWRNDYVNYKIFATHLAARHYPEARIALWMMRRNGYRPQAIADLGVAYWKEQRHQIPRLSGPPAESIEGLLIPFNEAIAQLDEFDHPPSQEEWDAAHKELEDYLRATRENAE